MEGCTTVRVWGGAITHTAADLGTGSGPSLCTMAQAARYAGFEEILGPGYPGHSDHTHLGNQGSRYWSASNCGI